MTFHYLITDINSEQEIDYSVEACSKEDANELFITKFFPLLPDVGALDIRSVIDICRDLDYDLKFINPTKSVKLN